MLKALLALSLLAATTTTTAFATEDDWSVREAYAKQSKDFRSDRKVPTNIPADQAYVQMITFLETCAKDGSDLTVSVTLYTSLASAQKSFPGCGVDETCYSRALEEKLLPRIKAAGFSPLKYMKPYKNFKMIGAAAMAPDKSGQLQEWMNPELERIVFLFASELGWDRYAIEPGFQPEPPEGEGNTCNL